MLQSALQPARTDIILPAFHEGRFELNRQNFLQNRNVFVEQLFLQIDGVRGNDRLLFLLERKKNCRHKIGDRFADAGARFNHKVPFPFERARHRDRHLLLFGPVFKIVRFREQTFFGKNRVNTLNKVTAERVPERNHRYLRLPICNLRLSAATEIISRKTVV